MDDIFDLVPERAMAVFAHPADAEIACGATLARWAASGCAIDLVICTRGDKGSHEPGSEASQVAATRTAEVDRAALELGLAGHEMLTNLDGEVTNSTELRALLVARIRSRRPEVVFGHDPTAVFIGSDYVNHRDHREVGFALVDAVAPAAGSPLYFPDAGKPHHVSTLLLSGTLEADAWVEVADHVDAKVAALRCHRSQLAGDASGVETLVRQRASEGRERTGLERSEAFRRINLG
ncbi:MAG TPA: PIG-L deacetylase family protein [Acidimicrobiales bacterium]|nr:PIG-L deacetylase family protein [Acidimicrobiales bacterium]